MALPILTLFLFARKTRIFVRFAPEKLKNSLIILPARLNWAKLGFSEIDISCEPNFQETVRIFPQIGIDVNGSEKALSSKFRDFLNLFAEKRKRISANKFSDYRKYSRLFAEINSRISANIFWMPLFRGFWQGRFVQCAREFFANVR